MKNTTDETLFYLCHGVGDTIHYVEVDPGLTLTSGQPSIDEYADKTALAEGIDVTFARQVDRDRIQKMRDFNPLSTPVRPKTTTKISASK